MAGWCSPRPKTPAGLVRGQWGADPVKSTKNNARTKPTKEWIQAPSTIHCLRFGGAWIIFGWLYHELTISFDVVASRWLGSHMYMFCACMCIEALGVIVFGGLSVAWEMNSFSLAGALMRPPVNRSTKGNNQGLLLWVSGPKDWQNPIFFDSYIQKSKSIRKTDSIRSFPLTKRFRLLNLEIKKDRRRKGKDWKI